MTTPQDIEKPIIPEFEEYIRQGEPEQKVKASLWQTAIGLQAVDGLQTSEYLRETARRNIEGEITLDEAHELIHGYYQKRAAHDEPTNEDEAEADRASSNIARILASQTLAFNTNGLIALHRRIFEGVFKHAGQLRTYDITKKEWVLHDDTVNYLNWEDLRRALDYEIEQERAFSYADLSNDTVVEHVSDFVSRLWQIHPFGEGNTRTTAVFTILYLRSIGFDVSNDLFANHAWYFRNALVRANYKNARLGVDYSPQYLERFFRNLLLGEQWDLRSRYLYINPPAEWQTQPNLAPEQVTRTSTRTSTEQVPEQVPEQVIQQTPANQTDPNLYGELQKQLVVAIGFEKLGIKEMLTILHLRHRPNFIEYHLRPAVNAGLVAPLYPNNLNHPRQKYLLTVKGMMLFNQLTK
ncbi:MAG: Fic family protein [Paludibacteraceae bacterium]|nr:Fic family protein [Paludibacteraceae bacterium]